MASPLPDKPFAALLFDMDGTILTSIAAAERVWRRWADEHGLDPVAILKVIHGVRSVDSVRRLNLPGVDPEAEAAKITRWEIEDHEGVVPIAGAARFLSSLPPERWSIVTSAPRKLAEARLAAAGLTVPRFIITGEDVSRGKPLPDCYLLAAERLGFSAKDCAVFEDAPAGIASGEASGATVVVVAATAGHEQKTSHPTIKSYDEIEAVAGPDGIRLVWKS